MKSKALAVGLEQTQIKFSPLLWALGMREGLTATTKGVLVALASYANLEGSCYPSIKRLASDACLSARTCQTAVRDLETAGFISVNRRTGRGHSSLYQLDLRRPTDNKKGAAVALIWDEKAQGSHPLPSEKAHASQPLVGKRVQGLHVKSAAAAPQLLKELSKQLTPLNHAPSTRVVPPKFPARSDPPAAWQYLADRLPDGGPKIEVHPDAGDDRGRPTVAGCYVDVAANLVCQAAGISDAGWRGDWGFLIAWLREGFDMDAVILPAIQRVANRPRYSPPSRLAYFDQAVREYRG